MIEDADKIPKPKLSWFREVISTLVSFTLEDIASKLGAALLSLIIGLALIFRPFQDADGKEVEKSFIPYLIGVILIVVSIVLIISWLKKRKKELKNSEKRHFKITKH